MSNVIKSLSDSNKIVASSLMKNGCPVVKYLLEQGKTFISPVQMSETPDTYTVTGGITATTLYHPDGVQEAMVAKESVILLGDTFFTTTRFLSCDKGDVLGYEKHPTRDFHILVIKKAVQTETVTPVKQKGKS